MSARNKILIRVGGLLSFSGLLIFLVLMFTNEPYGGSGGAGMAGLPAAFAMMIAFLILTIGLIMIIVSIVIRARKNIRL